MMLFGSKVYGDGADTGLVPDRSPHSRMKFVDSRLRSAAHGTSPVWVHRAGM